MRGKYFTGTGPLSTPRGRIGRPGVYEGQRSVCTPSHESAVESQFAAPLRTRPGGMTLSNPATTIDTLPRLPEMSGPALPMIGACPGLADLDLMPPKLFSSHLFGLMRGTWRGLASFYSWDGVVPHPASVSSTVGSSGSHNLAPPPRCLGRGASVTFQVSVASVVWSC